MAMRPHFDAIITYARSSVATTGISLRLYTETKLFGLSLSLSFSYKLDMKSPCLLRIKMEFSSVDLSRLSTLLTLFLSLSSMHTFGFQYFAVKVKIKI